VGEVGKRVGSPRVSDLQGPTHLQEREISGPDASVERTSASEQLTSSVGEMSLFETAAAILRNAHWILVSALLGAGIGLFPTIRVRPSYSSTATFTPQAAQDAGQAGLRSLAGQLGLAVTAGTTAQLPQFYVDLLRSRAVLEPTLSDSIAMSDDKARQVTVMEALGVRDTDSATRVERGVSRLRAMESAVVNAKTGVISLTVTSSFARLSASVASRLLNQLNEFNLRTRQAQASAERRYAESRLAEAKSVLRGGEDRMQTFLQQNRQTASSPQLQLERDRLQRELTIQQQVVMSLATAVEDARIREYRDTPVITVVERPFVALRPDPVAQLRPTLIGAVIGGFAAVFAVVVFATLSRLNELQDPGMKQLVDAAKQLRRRWTRRPRE
jgi:uncharacterized protein involved in exopolysaccharide biosynthesis